MRWRRYSGRFMLRTADLGLKEKKEAMIRYAKHGNENSTRKAIRPTFSARLYYFLIYQSFAAESACQPYPAPQDLNNQIGE